MSNQFDPPPPKNSGTNVLMIVLIVCGVLFLACAGICGALAFTGYRTAQNAAKVFTQEFILQGVAIQAHLAIEANEEAKAKFGTMSFGASSFDGLAPENLEATKVDIKFDVTGDKASGVAHCKGEQIIGNWRVTEIKIKLTDGTTLDIPTPSEDAPPSLNFDLGSETEVPKKPEAP